MRNSELKTSSQADVKYASLRLLSPLSAAYALVTSLRNYCYDRHLLATNKTELPVICVGNVTLGGSGKSPFTAYLAQELNTQGKTPVILSRGYRGRAEGPRLVRKNDSVEEVGDEAVMHCWTLGDSVPVVIAKNRSLGAKFIEENNLGDLIILDDGFQHRRLERDLNLLLLDMSSQRACRRWCSGEMLPSGYLRESLKQALLRADALIFVKRDTGHPEDIEQLPPYDQLPESMPKFTFVIGPSHFVDAFSGEEFSLDHFSGKQGSALTAIADAKPFFSMLEARGITLLKKKAFRDHHHFTRQEWQDHASSDENPVFTTAKDMVKLRHFINRPGQLYLLALSNRFFIEEQEKRFWEMFADLIEVENRSYAKPNC